MFDLAKRYLKIDLIIFVKWVLVHAKEIIKQTVCKLLMIIINQQKEMRYQITQDKNERNK